MWKSTELILRVDWIFITLEPLNLASALYTAVIQHVTLLMIYRLAWELDQTTASTHGV